MLWLYSMGIVLYWVHDTSQGCEKTYRLIDSTAPLAERLIRLARLPGPRSLTRRLLRIADDVLHWGPRLRRRLLGRLGHLGEA